jgi:Rrf2 family iron-sulfur cluster assembly transcriptional regulator
MLTILVGYYPNFLEILFFSKKILYQNMFLTKKSKYAVSAILEILETSYENPISLIDISKKRDISVSYLEKIFNQLRKHKIVDSVKGSRGGYYLSAKPSEISISQIIKAVEEEIKITDCGNSENPCIIGNKKCKTHDLWFGLEREIHRYLSSIKLSDFDK